MATMKLSIMVNPQGEIVAASIANNDRTPTRAAGPHAVDELRLPAGHSMQELDMPPELAKAFVDGTFSEAFQKYTLSERRLERK
jgi:hypothetical protein